MRIVAAGQRRIERIFGIEAQAGDAAVAGLELDEKIGQLVVAGRSAHQADVRSFFENLFAFLLRDASQDREGFAFAVFLELLKAIENFLLGFVADAAGVVEHQFGFLDGRDLRVALGHQGTDDFFGIVDVHLTAERLDVESFHYFSL